jgi:hypothetical protein
MSDLSVGELRARAAQYREMGRTATREVMVRSLLRLAERFETLAKQREDRDSAPDRQGFPPGGARWRMVLGTAKCEVDHIARRAVGAIVHHEQLPHRGRQMISITLRQYRNYEISVELDDAAEPPYRATIERLGQAHFGPTVFQGIEFDDVMIRARAEIDRVLAKTDDKI